MKSTKNGGLTKSRRIRDICLAAGYTFSVQDTVGSDIAFAAIVHLVQTVPEKFLHCILEPCDMVMFKTADGPFHVKQRRITAPNVPGLGVRPRLEYLRQTIAN
jgi:L-alanine-DL-glutamate epimerase-like enolase superfamily enzyme